MESFEQKLVGMGDSILRGIVFAAVGLSVLGGPWLFGAWEAWWFWPFVAVIGLGVSATGLRLVLLHRERKQLVSGHVRWILGASVPFLVYAIIRMWTAEVFMDAQRLVLLHFTALGVAMMVFLGLSSRQRLLLFYLLFANLLLLGLYGIVNHLVWGSETVLWLPRYAQYAGRATGSYFCPNHFSGVMELLLCVAIGMIADRGGALRWKLVAGAGALVAVAGVILSQSRGGGMTLVVVFVAVMAWSFAQWPRTVRWYLRLICISVALLATLVFLQSSGRYGARFSAYGGVREISVSGGLSRDLVVRTVDTLSRTCRGRMYAGAVRAWRSAVWFGIGPGMHQHLWPHFAPSSDGDRDSGAWPTLSNHEFRSYEVHNDWLQLLEEYGVVGFLLFGIPFLLIWRLLVERVSCERAVWEVGGEHAQGPFPFAVMLGGLLAVGAMSFHSLGDFNLQMPGTVWLFAAIVSLSLAGDSASPIRQKRTR